jgi:hypothetical protein
VFVDLKPIRDWLREVDWPWDALLVLLAAGVVASLVFGWSEAAALFAGTLFAAALILRFPPVVAGAAPLGDFLLGLRPLILPLVIVGVAGTVAYMWLIPFLLVPMLLVAGWTLLVAPELGKAIRAFRETEEWLRTFRGPADIVVAALIVLGAAAIVVVVVTLSPDAGFYVDRPESSNALLTLALVAWMVAAVLRLGGFATSWFRALIAVTSVLAIVRLLMAAGLVPGHDWLEDHASWLTARNLLLLTGAGLAVIVLANAVISLIPRLRFLETWGAFPVDLGPTLRGLGFTAAVLATVALGAAAFEGVISSEANRHSGVTPDEDVLTGKAKIFNPKNVPLPELAKDYQPVLVMTDDERWAPVSVDSYLQDPAHPARLIGRDGSSSPAPPLAELPGIDACRGGKEPCYRLTIDCATGDDDCAEGQPDRTDQGSAIPDYRDGAVYVRLLRHHHEGGSPQAFNGDGPYGADLTTLLQYWYFYRYDEWTRPVLGGRIVQRHEGDWEAVTIGLSQKAPLFLALSAHCGGTWIPWNRAEVAPTEKRRTHPLVAVAEGSHANYTNVQDRRAPDWAACKGVPKGTTTALSYASNLRDETSYGWDWMPAQTFIVKDDKPPMTFPGSWGGHDETVLLNEREQHLSADGGGPLTPRLQPLWYDPTHTIFCSKYWHGPAGC